MHSSSMRTDRCSGRHYMPVPGLPTREYLPTGKGVSAYWSGVPLDGDPTPCEQTNRCKSITFPCGR